MCVCVCVSVCVCVCVIVCVCVCWYKKVSPVSFDTALKLPDMPVFERPLRVSMYVSIEADREKERE